MLGQLPESPQTAAGAANSRSLIVGTASTIGERLLGAAEHRIRHGGDAPRAQRRRDAFATTMSAGLWLLVLKLLFGLVIVLILTSALQSVIGALTAASRVRAVQPAGQSALPVPQDVASGGVMQQMGAVPTRQAEVIDHYTGTTLEDRPRGMPTYTPPTAEEIRKSRRRADEAARIIEANTPEM